MTVSAKKRKLPTAAGIKRSQAQMPVEVQDFVDEQGTGLKDDPVEFVGRKKELDGLVRRIQRTTQGQDDEISLPAEMLIAAPGAGKTSMLTQLQGRLEKLGMAVVEANAEDFTSPEKFSDRVRKTPPWSDYATAKNVAAKVGESFVQGLDSLLGTGAQVVGIVATGGSVAKPDVDLVERVVKVWKNNGTPDIEDCLKLLDHGRAQGCVVLLDEAQELRELTGDPKSTEGRVATQILRTLGKPKDRGKGDVSRSTLVLAGLSDTNAVVETLGSPGIEPRVLAPLPLASVRVMITNAIRVGAKQDEALQSEAIVAWLDLLAERYGDWTRIAQAGAEAARLLLKEYGGDAVHQKWGLGALVALADEKRRSVYRAAITRAEKENVSTLLRNAVSFGLLCNNNRIDHDTMDDVIDACALHREPGLTRAERRETREANVLRMLRAGLIDVTTHLPNAGSETHYYCPIPSLITHIADGIETRRKVIREILAGAGLRNKRPKKLDHLFQPQWPIRADDSEDDQD